LAYFLRQLVAFLILGTGNPAEAYQPAMTVQVIEHRLCFIGGRQVQSFADTPLAGELVDYQDGISTDGGLSRWTGSQILQYLENTSVFRHVIGHGAALTDQAMLL
jgi:hypothetical protein